jgi:hypothetical protein
MRARVSYPRPASAGRCLRCRNTQITNFPSDVVDGEEIFECQFMFSTITQTSFGEQGMHVRILSPMYMSLPFESIF